MGDMCSCFQKEKCSNAYLIAIKFSQSSMGLKDRTFFLYEGGRTKRY
jgi:hypothetical protein